MHRSHPLSIVMVSCAAKNESHIRMHSSFLFRSAFSILRSRNTILFHRFISTLFFPYYIRSLCRSSAYFLISFQEFSKIFCSYPKHLKTRSLSLSRTFSRTPIFFFLYYLPLSKLSRALLSFFNFWLHFS